MAFRAVNAAGDLFALTRLRRFPSFSCPRSQQNQLGYPTSSQSNSYCSISKPLNVEPTIGLELHVQLASQSKLFSSARGPMADLESNTNVALFDAAIPGTQPILSWDCLRLALVASLALKCDVQSRIGFDRKHYFYPDLPAGYQITQHYSPIAKNGRIHIGPRDGSPRAFDVRIKQVQLEQDTAKSYKDPLGDNILIDLNRSGAALIEIVTEPDIQSAREASIFVRKLQAILRATGVSKGNMEQGSLRCDVNVSVKPKGSTSYGTRCEIKNVNGLGNIEQAITYEVTRQAALLEKNEDVITETRGFDMAKQSTFRLRSKETVTDYRYMPDADIPPISIPSTVVERFRELVPELPDQTADRIHSQYRIPIKTSEILLAIGQDSIDNVIDVGCGIRFFEAVMAVAEPETNGKVVADWILNDLLGLLSKHEIAFVDTPVSPIELARLINSVAKKAVPRPIAREMLDRAIQKGRGSLSQELEDYLKVSNESGTVSTEELAVELIKDMTHEVTLIRRGGHDRIVGKLVGEGMRRSQRRADPVLLKSTLERLLDISKDVTEE
ncbi:GatB/GatE catalytic domain-containing protein [Melampsora americana]|nr:GatB/GatE catalytic domain-containing protein [Melampsora americana]